MANCDDLFREFDERIKLSESKKDSLQTSRNDLRGKVKEKYKEKGYDVKFYWQGSFATNTIIAPKDDDFDIDDGLYIQSDEIPSEIVETLHDWVVSAAENHTSIPPTDKNPGIRVRFKAGYHVDLVIYHKKTNEHPKLAHKSKGWIESDPKEFKDWFASKCDDGGQLKRVVRYFKAWADELRGDMPSGLIFTILAADNVRFNERDDIAFLETMKAIKSSLDDHFECYRPTTPHEDLLVEYSETRKNYLMDRLSSFITSGEQALEMVNQKDACPKWQRHFGDRFPCELAEDSMEDAKTFAAPAFIKSDARSA